MQVGLYGKLPSHGDFLRRRTSDAFVGVLDPWLQDCMSSSRAALGDRWLNVYLTSPAWRFAAAAGACGPTPVMGLMVPSVDRVGRYFPLTLVAELPGQTSVINAVTTSGAFFAHAERLVIETLEAEYVDFESFDERVVQLADDLLPLNMAPRVILGAPAAGILGENGASSWQVPIDSPQTLAPVFDQLLSHRLSEVYGSFMVWWTEGSSIVEPSCLITRGLPEPERFAALLDGSWGRYGWQSAPAQVDRAAAEDGLIDDRAPLRFRSAAASDVGRVREINEDAFLERPESGLWVVADGLGGHADGENASRMVCDAFADFVQTGSFEETIDAARDRLTDVNDHLVRAAARSLLGERSGSTVVVLLVRGSQCAVLWAGDSRAYRFRGGRLEQLTEDHSVSAARGQTGQGESHAVTRAVGAHSTLMLDLVRDEVQIGDRYLLCSDGLIRVVPEPQIRSWMEHTDLRAAADGLVEATLDGGAPDNVTVLITQADEDTRAEVQGLL